MNELDKSFLIIKVMKQFGKVMKENFEKRFNDLNLTSTQGMVVGILIRNGEMKISDLGKRMYLSNSTVSGLIDRLENHNIVERRRNKDDRRIVMVDLTEEFKKEAHERFHALDNHISSIIKLATPEELDQILEGFQILSQLMCRFENNYNS